MAGRGENWIRQIAFCRHRFLFVVLGVSTWPPYGDCVMTKDSALLPGPFDQNQQWRLFLKVRGPSCSLLSFNDHV